MFGRFGAKKDEAKEKETAPKSNKDERSINAEYLAELERKNASLKHMFSVSRDEAQQLTTEKNELLAELRTAKLKQEALDEMAQERMEMYAEVIEAKDQEITGNYGMIKRLKKQSEERLKKIHKLEKKEPN